MMMLLWTLAVTLVAPPPEAPVFDEAALRLRYEGFFLKWLKPLNLETGPQVAFRALYEAHPKPLPEWVDPWPVDPARGMLVNDVERRPRSLAWEAVDVETTPEEPPTNFGLLFPVMYDVDFVALTPKLCVPEACWFESPRTFPSKKPVVRKPGFWVALRMHFHRPIIVGVLMYKSVPRGDPRQEPLFIKWRAELATRFPLTP